MVKVGDYVHIHRTVDGCNIEIPDNRIGKVLWIHPENRFANVEFRVSLKRKYTECFPLYELIPAKWPREEK